MHDTSFSIGHGIFCFPAGDGPAIVCLNLQPDVQLERCCPLRLSIATPTLRWTGVPSLRAPPPHRLLRSGLHGHPDGLTAALSEGNGIAVRQPGIRVWLRWNGDGVSDVNRERPLDV
jgi:hypothetical protein